MRLSEIREPNSSQYSVNPRKSHRSLYQRAWKMWFKNKRHKIEILTEVRLREGDDVVFRQLAANLLGQRDNGHEARKNGENYHSNVSIR